MNDEIAKLSSDTIWILIGIAAIFLLYLAFSAAFYWLHKLYKQFTGSSQDFTSLKTVTFGDESAVTAIRFASVFAVLSVFLIWGIFTGSKLVPIHVPGPFLGDTSFQYTAQNAAGETNTAKVSVRVHVVGEQVDKIEADAEADGFAQNDAVTIGARRSGILKAQKNDIGGQEDGYKVIEINGKSIVPEQVVEFENGTIFMTKKGSLSIRPEAGMQMENLYLPSPEAVWSRFIKLSKEGYQNVSLLENVFWSLVRVVLGLLLGCLFGIPLGFAMGLNSWLRGWFDPIVEFMRPIPPLALIPLFIIWFGIGEQGKIGLLFLAALWIMTIAARAGVSGVNISKVHAAYSLGASKFQLLTKVILPNSLPEIFTGARVAMGVCWGTVVAAELVAAQKGTGMMIMVASKYSLTDIVIIGIIIIGVIGYAIEVIMRKIENKLVPWKGHS